MRPPMPPVCDAVGEENAREDGQKLQRYSTAA